MEVLPALVVEAAGVSPAAAGGLGGGGVAGFGGGGGLESLRQQQVAWAVEVLPALVVWRRPESLPQQQQVAWEAEVLPALVVLEAPESEVVERASQASAAPPSRGCATG